MNSRQQLMSHYLSSLLLKYLVESQMKSSFTENFVTICQICQSLVSYQQKTIMGYRIINWRGKRHPFHYSTVVDIGRNGCTQYNTMQCNAVQCSAVQYYTAIRNENFVAWRGVAKRCLVLCCITLYGDTTIGAYVNDGCIIMIYICTTPWKSLMTKCGAFCYCKSKG